MGRPHRASTLFVLFACALLGAGCAEEAPGLSEEELSACADPVASPGAFEDIADGAGVTFEHVQNPELTDEAPEALQDYVPEMTAGVVSADLDQDGWPDLFFPQSEGTSELYWGIDGRQFARAGASAGLEGLPPLASAAAAVDFDGDGLLDLAVGALGRVVLMHNLGERRFADVTEAVGLVDREGIVAGLVFGDVEGDGDLDLFVCRHLRDSEPHSGVLYSAKSDLWRNEQGGFSLQTEVLPYPQGDGGACLHATWFDIDLDGDVDLLQSNDFGDFYLNSLLMENHSDGQVWSFGNRIQDSQVGVLRAPMGMAARDLDGNGLPDLWFSNLGINLVFSQLETWSFTDTSVTWGAALPVEDPWTSWSVMDIDLDGDGKPGILVTYGPLLAPEAGDTPQDTGEFEPILEQPDRFAVRSDAGGSASFVEVDAGLSTTANSRGVGLSDLDRDGVPDVVIGQIGAGPALMRGRCTENNRLVVELRDPRAYNHFGVGARVLVSIDGTVQSQQMLGSGRGTFSGSDPVLFFGTGTAERVDRIEVQWPDGEVQSYEDVCAHCRLRIDYTAQPPG